MCSWSISGPATDRLGREAVVAWRRIHDADTLEKETIFGIAEIPRFILRLVLLPQEHFRCANDIILDDY